MAVAHINIEWVFVSECPIPNDVHNILVPGETPVAAYKTFRDMAIFTSKRLIVRDAQGITGKKVEIYSLPYSSIDMWSSENGGNILDRTAEIELWTKAGHFKIVLHKGVDVRKLDLLIANAVL
ncbi:PH domain-containing protein [Paenibacillus sp. NPDC058071]|uniref:PH domain-containing protein n=1 Tax=Paenibacillus sp. NPDC058071 TaxID=3346326 RepID=UPI0036DD6469